MKIEQNHAGIPGFTMITCTHGVNHQERIKNTGDMASKSIAECGIPKNALTIEPNTIFLCCDTCAARVERDALLNLVHDGITVTLSKGAPVTEVDLGFVRLMDEKLRKNNHRGDWRSWAPNRVTAFAELHEHTDKLYELMTSAVCDGPKIALACADVANYAMMISARFGVKILEESKPTPPAFTSAKCGAPEPVGSKTGGMSTGRHCVLPAGHIGDCRCE